jgi:hypothetical protein
MPYRIPPGTKLGARSPVVCGSFIPDVLSDRELPNTTVTPDLV